MPEGAKRRAGTTLALLTGDCVMFQVSVSDAGRVTQTGQGPDPACDGPNGRD